MRRLALVGIVATSLLVPAASADAATYYVRVRAITFDTVNAAGAFAPAPNGNPTVDPGDTILWHWEPKPGFGSHDVVSGNLNTGTPDGKFNTNGLRTNGATFTYTTGLAAANYTYFCTPHRPSGMKGTIKATGTTNEPPVAKLVTTPAQPTPGETVTLDASTSTDPEAQIAPFYQWDLDGNGTFELETSTPSTTRAVGAGNNVFRVRVFDAGSAISETAVTVTAEFPDPIVATGAGTPSGPSAATVGGTVNPKGTATTWTVEYGPTTDYGSTTSPVDAGSGTTDVPVSAELSGLTPATEYHFRIVATNAGGTAAGADATFTTPAPPSAPPPSTPPTGGGGTGPVVTTTIPAVQSLASGNLGLTVTPAQAVTLRLTGRIPIRGRKTIVLRPLTRQGAAGTPVRLTWRLTRKQKAAVRAALARGLRVRATLVLEARDAAGNVTRTTRRVRLKR